MKLLLSADIGTEDSRNENKHYMSRPQASVGASVVDHPIPAGSRKGESRSRIELSYGAWYIVDDDRDDEFDAQLPYCVITSAEARAIAGMLIAVADEADSYEAELRQQRLGSP